MMKRFALLALLLVGLSAQAIDPLPFKDPAEEVRFQNLVRELRCLVCQNQNLADSDATLAKDLRAEVLDLMHSGKNDTEIKAFLTERYGDFVLYKPPVRPGTWLLWFGPLLVLAVGALIAGRLLRRTRSSDAAATNTTQDGEFDG